ncbi:MAG: UPF0182 family protein [Chlamydiota bacterium]
MYLILFVFLIAASIYCLQRGINSRNHWYSAAGVALLALVSAFLLGAKIWVEALWFGELDYIGRFWTEIFAKAGFSIVSGLITLGVMYLLTWYLANIRPIIRRTVLIISAFIGLGWGYLNWALILKFWYSTLAGVSDPILERDISFYLFSLPLYQSIYVLVLFLAMLSVAAYMLALLGRIHSWIRGMEIPHHLSGGRAIYSGLYLSAAALIFVLAWGRYLDRFRLLFSKWGVVNGAGWTDVNVRLPAYWVVIAVMVLVGVFLLITPWRRKFVDQLTHDARGVNKHLTFFISAAIAIGGVTFIALGVIPALFQWLLVEPNEISYESPYIDNNIQFTRQAFKLNTVQVRDFPAVESFGKQDVAESSQVFDNIRLWDRRALQEVYNQFQEIRLYYNFYDVDVDRYNIDGKYSQVMISAREMQPSNLPARSQTFVNKRFKYTHGYGITLTKVNEFTPDGLPNLLIKDIPPKWEYPNLAVDRPEIYYGELTYDPVIANSSEKEFDYPKGDKNVYTHYQGQGGIPISNLWRKFLFGWRFDGTTLFVSNYPTPDSRMMYRRQIKERAKALAPFLDFDDDAYVVLADGKLYWILDAYTSTNYYPYSEEFTLEGIEGYTQGRQSEFFKSKRRGPFMKSANYLRNSVKVVIDAYDGSADFYVFDPQDPIIKVWQAIFPSMFKERQEMPTSLMEHVRYPRGFLLMQGLAYAKYHMKDVDVFYNQEDLWVRATEKYRGQVQAVEPYYILWQPPGTNEVEFILMQPFTPKNKQVLIGWIAGMCDGDNYGKFLAYQFPKEKRVIGPQQVETKIDQDAELSSQLSLWDQLGSRVIRGNVLAMPIGEILLYVEPIYLQSDTSAYPELRLVVLMHNDNLAYAENFPEALKVLLGESTSNIKGVPAGMSDKTSLNQLIEEADNSFDRYLRKMGDQDFEGASEALDDLQDKLEKLMEKSQDNSR